jgi:hypothetical protein
MGYMLSARKRVAGVLLWRNDLEFFQGDAI